MTDVTADYLALRREVAAVRVNRDVIRVFGADAISFLQGQLSQDLSTLEPGRFVWSLLLEPQGKVIAWLRVWGRRVDDEVLLDVDGGSGQVVVDRLNRFRLRVKCELELLDWQCVALRGPACPAPAEITVSAELKGEVHWPGVPGVDLLGPGVELPEGIHEAGDEAIESVRIEAGWPANGREFTVDPDPSVIPGEAGHG
jgi:folate-binding Fe-S cluster repair protein YgfZ